MRRILLVLMALAAGPVSAAGGDETRTAVFAGGCFWCMEPPYDKLEGVTSTISGFAGGDVPNPTYEEVSAGGTGHIEVVQITYDPAKVSYETLLAVYWRNIDPTDDGGQFCDRGETYKPVIFYRNQAQKRAAQRSRAALEKNKPFEGEIRVPIRPVEKFYSAEPYHQNYYKKNPVRYKFYRWNCGRDDRLEALWGKQARGAGIVAGEAGD